MLRAQRHHDDHQRQVSVALATAVTQLGHEVARLEDGELRLATDIDRGVAKAHTAVAQSQVALAHMVAEQGRALQSQRSRLDDLASRAGDNSDSHQEELAESVPDAVGFPPKRAVKRGSTRLENSEESVPGPTR